MGTNVDNEIDSETKKPTDFTVVCTGDEDLVGQVKAAQFAISNGWREGEYILVAAGDFLYAVKFNKKSARVWPQGKYRGDC